MVILTRGTLTFECIAGKSTLLQILAGKRLISKPDTDVQIKERDVFRQYPQGVTFLGTEWYESHYAVLVSMIR